MTRMAGAAEGEPADATAAMAPELVAPMVAFLAHEDCPVSGEIYAAGAGRFARIFIASTEGYVHPAAEPTVEDVAEHWAHDQRRDRLLRARRPHRAGRPPSLAHLPPDDAPRAAPTDVYPRAGAPDERRRREPGQERRATRRGGRAARSTIQS